MKVKLRSYVKHNGKWYNDGETIGNIKKDDGERLIQLGVAEEVVGESSTNDDTDPKDSKSNKSSKEPADDSGSDKSSKE